MSLRKNKHRKVELAGLIECMARRFIMIDNRLLSLPGSLIKVISGGQPGAAQLGVGQEPSWAGVLALGIGLVDPQAPVHAAPSVIVHAAPSVIRLVGDGNLSYMPLRLSRTWRPRARSREACR